MEKIVEIIEDYIERGAFDEDNFEKMAAQGVIDNYELIKKNVNSMIASLRRKKFTDEFIAGFILSNILRGAQQQLNERNDRILNECSEETMPSA